MKYIVIGLGSFGSTLAVSLTNLGHEVIGVDIAMDRVDAIKDRITSAICIEVSGISALSALPLKDIDCAIVGIGENFGASVQVVALLKEIGVEKIYARAINDLHQSVLEALQITRILTPEQDSANQLAKQLNFARAESFYRIDQAHFVVKFAVPTIYYGKTLNEIRFDKNYNLWVLAVTKKIKKKNILSLYRDEEDYIDEKNLGDVELKANHYITLYGTQVSFNDFWKSIPH